MDSWFKMKLIEGDNMQALAIYTELERDYIYQCRSESNQEQVVWRFPNDYGASVAANRYTDYNAELAVVKFEKEPTEDRPYKLVYDTPITSDIVPHVSKNDVRAILEEIKKL
jgi:hypothetical protein